MESRMESWTRVANGSREWESRNGVANMSREIKKIGGVCKKDPKGSNYLIKKLCTKEICSVDNIGPGWLGPFFKRSVP